MSISHTFHVVDKLPGGAAVACVDDRGDVHTYWARDADLERIAADLGVIFNTLAQTGEYVRVADTPVAV